MNINKSLFPELSDEQLLYQLQELTSEINEILDPLYQPQDQPMGLLLRLQTEMVRREVV